ncbi:MAG: OB-fold putative lipoprotein [Bacteroidetes bacterium]|nr:OB-fold putative lipoprotein [Bacteroidota bacterium]
MTEKRTNKKGWIKKALFAFLLVVLLAGGAFWYIMNETFDDTAATQSAYTVSAQDLINAYQTNDSIANAAYREQIITVQGRVTEVEAADTTVNIKFTDPVTGSYLIFDFQSQHLADAKVLQAGDSVAIKGSCSGNIYSQLRKAHMISFKRSVLVAKF